MAGLMESIEMEKLTYKIFSILENKFLFGDAAAGSCYEDSLLEALVMAPKFDGGRVRIISIDGSAGASGDCFLAVASLVRLESSLRSHSGDPNARIADYFDVAAGSGTGGALAAMLFTGGADGRPLFTADEALRFLTKNRRKIDVSLGNGETPGSDNGSATAPSKSELLKIAGNSFADTAVAMAFGHHLAPNYVRIQANGFVAKRSSTSKNSSTDSLRAAEEMLSHRNIESMMFQGRKISELSNATRLDDTSDQLITEQERRKLSPIPTVVIRHAMTPPRTSSATTACTSSPMITSSSTESD